ncbi:hypothetical protein [Actinacidiphila oryziradicis]|jgi:Flp pilus assembly protein TadB|uniref:hypothetical protein n=1 Tax=Actinacidiphila oryziradicis TaxID=2571141 RepID=UPI0023F3998F|nr:hypothetical protein [Actinacidiphila oryziradicis]MCW2874361.1 hypothetical protein [Actinacidiphila oryziradicis]
MSYYKILSSICALAMAVIGTQAGSSNPLADWLVLLLGLALFAFLALDMTRKAREKKNPDGRHR